MPGWWDTLAVPHHISTRTSRGSLPSARARCGLFDLGRSMSHVAKRSVEDGAGLFSSRIYRRLATPRASLAATGTRLGPDLGPGQHLQHRANDLCPVGGFGKGQIRLDLIPIATSFPFLHDVAIVSQVANNAKRAPFGDTDFNGDVAKPHFWITSNAQEQPTVVAEEGPLGHGRILAILL